MSLFLHMATEDDASVVADLSCTLLEEIMSATGEAHYSADRDATEALARQWLNDGTYTTILASNNGRPAGLANITQSAALYAGGLIGVIQEFYICPPFRGTKIGHSLMESVKTLARQRGWRRLELCTPPLPAFERSKIFYEANGFARTGGHKMKCPL